MSRDAANAASAVRYAPAPWPDRPVANHAELVQHDGAAALRTHDNLSDDTLGHIDTFPRVMLSALNKRRPLVALLERELFLRPVKLYLSS